MRNLYIDAEWFPNQDVFLIGYARENAKVYQLYNRSLTKKAFAELLKETTGYIFFYGPDIALCENYFNIDIRNSYKCVNLLRITRAYMPHAKSWKLEHIEKVFHLKRNEAKYKKSIFQIYSDWYDDKYKERVLSYNRDDVYNLVIIKQKLFERYGITTKYLDSILLR